MKTQSFVYIVGTVENLKEEQGIQKGIIISQRTSGVIDKIPFEYSGKEDILEGQATIAGKIETRNVRDKQGKSHKQMFINASVYINSNMSFEVDKNQVEMSCLLVKKDKLRTTPLGKQVMDIVVAINDNGKSYYPSCIVWESTAEVVEQLPIGTKMKIQGRFQSRDYEKVLGDRKEIRTAYEISIGCVEVV